MALFSNAIPASEHVDVFLRCFPTGEAQLVLVNESGADVLLATRGARLVAPSIQGSSAAPALTPVVGNAGASGTAFVLITNQFGWRLEYAVRSTATHCAAEITATRTSVAPYALGIEPVP